MKVKFFADRDNVWTYTAVKDGEVYEVDYEDVLEEGEVYFVFDEHSKAFVTEWGWKEMPSYPYKKSLFDVVSA